MFKNILGRTCRAFELAESQHYENLILQLNARKKAAYERYERVTQAELMQMDKIATAKLNATKELKVCHHRVFSHMLHTYILFIDTCSPFFLFNRKDLQQILY